MNFRMQFGKPILSLSESSIGNTWINLKMDCTIIKKPNKLKPCLAHSPFALWHHFLIKENLESNFVDNFHGWPATCPTFCANSCSSWGQNPILKSLSTSINRGELYSQKLENLGKLWPFFFSKIRTLGEWERQEILQNQECGRLVGGRF